MKYFLLMLCALVLLCTCATPPRETVRAFQQPTPSLAPQPTAASAVANPAPEATGLIAGNLPLILNSQPMPTLLPTPTSLPTATLEPPWRFAVLGDTRTSGLDPPAMMGQIVDLARAERPAVTIVVGDLINALDDEASVREQWRRWRATIAPLGANAQSPWMLVTPGNHDVQGHSWATDLMAEAFPELPDNGPVGLKRLAYRFDYRGVRFISVHTEMFGDPHHLGTLQLAWLEDQLKQNPNRYTIVYGHDPAFPIGPHIGNALDVYPAERDAFWALLKQYQVTAYISGHEHLYNRQTIDGVTQLVVGTSGSFPYSGFGGDFHHYLSAEVASSVMTMAVYDSRGQERDRFTLQAR